MRLRHQSRQQRTSGELGRSRCHWPWPKRSNRAADTVKTVCRLGRAQPCHVISAVTTKSRIFEPVTPLIGCERAVDDQHHHEKGVLRLAEHRRRAFHIKPSWREKELILWFFDCYRVVPPKTTHVFKSLHTATTRALLQFQFTNLRSARRRCAGLACSS